MHFPQRALEIMEIEMGITTRMNPLTAIAAVSVTLFGLAGIGAIACLIPTNDSQAAEIRRQIPPNIR